MEWPFLSTIHAGCEAEFIPAGGQLESLPICRDESDLDPPPWREELDGWKVRTNAGSPMRPTPHSPPNGVPEEYGTKLSEYRSWFPEDEASDDARRRADYAALVNRYYDLATLFYEIGWGRSFHFAPLHRELGRKGSLRRYERRFAEALGLGAGDEALDLGCGVGGPLIHLAKVTGASIIGINNNPLQIRRGTRYLKKSGLEGRCRLVLADFMNLPFGENSVDAIYSIEAIPHAPDKEALFREIHRVLRPGASFVASDWCVTDRFDPRNAAHRRILRELEMGNGLPCTSTCAQVKDALAGAGFEILEFSDLTREAPTDWPWFGPLAPRPGFPLDLVKDPRVGRWINGLLRILERIRLLPRGTAFVHDMLGRGAEALVEAGKEGIFTPLLFFLVRKPGPETIAPTPETIRSAGVEGGNPEGVT